MTALAQLRRKAALREEDNAAELIREAQKLEAVGRLVSGVAHDFNNLLTGIVLCSELLLAGLHKENRLRRYAQEIRTAGAQGAVLIQQLVAVARPEASGRQALSFNEAITGALKLLNRLIGENIELTTELAPDLALLNMDPAQVQQIIFNLILNARDAMPDGGQIRLITRNCGKTVFAEGTGPSFPDGHIEFEVEDTGCGMDTEIRGRAFEPFFTTKKLGKGTGLGLATVDGIVKSAGGQTEIESTPGQGTRIIVRLPQMRPEAQPAECENLSAGRTSIRPVDRGK